MTALPDVDLSSAASVSGTPADPAGTTTTWTGNRKATSRLGAKKPKERPAGFSSRTPHLSVGERLRSTPAAALRLLQGQNFKVQMSSPPFSVAPSNFTNGHFIKKEAKHVESIQDTEQRVRTSLWLDGASQHVWSPSIRPTIGQTSRRGQHLERSLRTPLPSSSEERSCQQELGVCGTGTHSPLQTCSFFTSSSWERSSCAGLPSWSSLSRLLTSKSSTFLGEWSVRVVLVILWRFSLQPQPSEQFPGDRWFRADLREGRHHRSTLTEALGGKRKSSSPWLSLWSSCRSRPVSWTSCFLLAVWTEPEERKRWRNQQPRWTTGAGLWSS